MKYMEMCGVMYVKQSKNEISNFATMLKNIIGT